jgi:arylsulfatase A-like enzyme
LSPLLLRGESPAPRPLYWASLSNRGNRSEAMRDGAWKLVVQHPNADPGTFEHEKVELYNLHNDPGEKTDVADDHPRQIATMLKQLKQWYAETQQTATPQPGGW